MLSARQRTRDRRLRAAAQRKRAAQEESERRRTTLEEEEEEQQQQSHQEVELNGRSMPEMSGPMTPQSAAVQRTPFMSPPAAKPPAHPTHSPTAVPASPATTRLAAPSLNLAPSSPSPASLLNSIARLQMAQPPQTSVITSSPVPPRVAATLSSPAPIGGLSLLKSSVPTKRSTSRPGTPARSPLPSPLPSPRTQTEEAHTALNGTTSAVTSKLNGQEEGHQNGTATEESNGSDQLTAAVVPTIIVPTNDAFAPAIDTSLPIVPAGHDSILAFLAADDARTRLRSVGSANDSAAAPALTLANGDELNSARTSDEAALATPAEGDIVKSLSDATSLPPAASSPSLLPSAAKLLAVCVVAGGIIWWQRQFIEERIRRAIRR